MNEHERALSALCAIDPGVDRETWVKVGMAAHAAGIAEDEWIEWSTPAPNFAGDRDCRQVWRSFTDGATKAGTLFYLAREAGWRDPAKANGAHHYQQSRSAAPSSAGTRSGPFAAEVWDLCEPATAAHPYIVRKRGDASGLRVVTAESPLTIKGQRVGGWLVVPAVSLAGELRTLQFVPPNGGSKLNLPGSAFGDGLHVVGTITESAAVYICEGVGQAWACHQATGDAAAVTFGAGRMESVAASLRTHFPEARLVIVCDRGKEQQAERIAKSVRGAFVTMPEDKPANYDANDLVADYGADLLAQLLAQPKSPAMRYRLMGAADLASLPPMSWFVRGVVPSQGLAAIFGASGSGKSFLALDLCAAVASAASWFSYRVNPAPVVYAALEGEAGIRNRAKAWETRHGTPLPRSLRFVLQPFDLRKPQDVADLVEAVIASGSAGGLLVIDTLNRAASGADENSSSDMGQLIDAAKAMQALLGGLVMFVHHSGKDQTKGLRGHSSLHAALDAAIEVTRTDDRRSWRIAKSKDDSDSDAHSFRLEVVAVGEEEDGEPVTSCVVVPDSDPAPVKRLVPPKSGNQRIAFDAVANLLRATGTTCPADAAGPVPANRPYVALQVAVDEIRDRLVCDPKRRTERAQQALTGLHAKGLVVVNEGYVWMP